MVTKTALLNRATELGVQSWDEEELIMSTDEHVLKQCTEFTMIVSGPLPDPEDDEIEQEEEEEIWRKSRSSRETVADIRG